MKYAKMLVAMMLLVVFTLAAQTPQYIGADKCKMCHMSKAKGEQFGIWQGSKHSQAYTVLTTEQAKAVAQKAGQGGEPPEDNPACLKCHVAGWDAPAAMLGPKYVKAEGVTCESCHGPGEDYSPMKIMQDKDLSIQNGMVLGNKETCVKCHNSESPTYKPFNYDTFWPKIEHKIPKTQ